VILIHGLYLTPACWDEWRRYLEGRGFKVLTPAYPGLSGDPAAIRARHPDPNLARLTLPEVLQSYRDIIAGLDEKPILIGHSMGGLIAQILLNEGRAAGAIAISSAPTNGIVSPATAGFVHGFRFVRNGWGFVDPFASDDEPLTLSLEKFKNEFANGIPEPEQERLFNALTIPASRRLGKGALTDDSIVDLEKARGPLLFVSAAEDHIIPPSVNRKNAAAYAPSAGLTELREFEARGHFFIRQSGWEEVADSIIKWIEEQR
jgi:pimeloyl-ACP methyl ester carboxylesterase